MSTVKVAWRIESYDEYETTLEVPEDMTAEQFIQQINEDPDWHLTDYEEDSYHTSGGVTERDVTSAAGGVTVSP